MSSRVGHGLLWFAIHALILPPSQGAPAKWLVLGPMLGHVADVEANLWVKASAPARVSVRIGDNPTLSGARTVKGLLLASDRESAGTVRLTGLQPDHTYHYTVMLDGREVVHPPYPSFRSAPVEGTAGRHRVCFVSCSGYEPHEPAAGWADIGSRTNVDLILMMGDNHYANSPQRAVQRKAYLGQRNSPGFLAVTRRIPTYGIWDDHDFGPNDSDGTLPAKEEALEAFQEHWANPGYGEPGNPGVYFKFTRGEIEFFCLDGRYHRSPNKSPDQPGKTMLGVRQLEWLKESLAASKARVKVLVSGSEWQSHGTPDSWTSFIRERDEVFRFIEDRKVSGVILLSGDRHFTGAYQVKGRFIEVTSGPVGGNTSGGRIAPEMFMNHNQGRFYCIYDIDTLPSSPVLTLEIYQIGFGLVNRRTFTWDEVNGRTPIPPLPPLPTGGR